MFLPNKCSYSFSWWLALAESCQKYFKARIFYVTIIILINYKSQLCIENKPF